MATKSFWKRGQMAAFARAAGVPQQQISDILHRRRVVGKDLAVKLEQVSIQTLRRRIPTIEWLFNAITGHPAFFTAKTTKKRTRKRK